MESAMKLVNLSVDRFGVCDDQQFSDFLPTLNLVTGPSGCGKSTLRHLIRAILYGLNDDQVQSYLERFEQGRVGSLTMSEAGHSGSWTRIQDGSSEGQLDRDDPHGVIFGNTDSSQNRVLEEVDPATYVSLFSVSFEETRSLLGRIVSTLRTRLGVDCGESGQVDRRAYDQWHQEQKDLEQQIRSLEQRLSSNRTRRTQLQSEMDASQSAYQAHLNQLDDEIRRLTENVSRLQSEYDSLSPRRSSILAEIDEIQRRIEHLKHQTEFVPANHVCHDPKTVIQFCLEQLDEQIESWRAVQTSVQAERERLRDEMQQVQDVRLDCETHPYHQAQMLMSEMEQQLETLEVQARTWLVQQQGDGHSERIDDMADQCVDIRKQLHNLCDELGLQYKHVRHRAAVAELKQLRVRYEEVTERLHFYEQQRTVFKEQLRRSNGGTPTISTDWDPSFPRRDWLIQWTEKLEGLGWDGRASADLYRKTQPDYSAESSRLIQLQRELQSIESRFHSVESELRTAQSRLDEAIERRNRLPAPDLVRLNQELQDLELEHGRLSDDLDYLRNQLQQQPPRIETVVNPVVDDASTMLARITSGRMSRVWLDRDGRDVQVRLREGQAQSYASLVRNDQTLVNLVLLLAGCREYHRRQFELPVCLDELIENLDARYHEPTLRLLESVSRDGLQVILFSRSLDHSQILSGHAYKHFVVNQVTRTQSRYTETPEPVRTLPVRVPTPYRLELPVHSTVMHNDVPKSQSNGTGESMHRVASPSPIDHSTLIRNLSLLDTEAVKRLGECGIHTVADLLDVDPDLMDVELTRREVTSDQIHQWQSQLWLKIAVPELSYEDAELLYLSGISDPIQFDDLDAEELRNRLRMAWERNRSRRSSSSFDRYSGDRMSRWYSSFGRNRSLWRNHQRYSRRNRQRRRWEDRDRTPHESRMDRAVRTRDRMPRSRDNSRRSDSGLREQREYESGSESRQSSSTPSAASKKGLKFYLCLSDDLEAAPSIGPRTAERFANIGVVTVQDFLDASSVQMAKDIDYKRIKEKDIADWQSQARLVCQIPNLRGHDSQILVACGITEPAEVAEMGVDQLLGIVGPFSKTKEGQKILRQASPPDHEEVTNWIDWAKQTRPLSAAA